MASGTELGISGAQTAAGMYGGLPGFVANAGIGLGMKLPQLTLSH